MIPDWQLHLVETYEDVQRLLGWCEEIPSVAIDTETTGLQWWTPRFTRLVQFGCGDHGWAVPVEWWGRPVMQALDIIARRGIPVVMHNAKFDMHALEADGFPVPSWEVVHDTKIQDHLLVPHANHSLKPMCERRFGQWTSIGQGELRRRMSEKGWTWATIPVDEPSYWQYGILDTLLTWHAHQQMMPQLDAGGYLPVYETEMVVQAVMYAAETRGMRIDHRYAEQLRHTWQAEAVQLAEQLEAAGISNPRSNRELTEYLTRLGWEPDEWTPTGAAKLDKVVLQQLSQIYPDIAPAVLRFKRITKWSTVYLDRFINDRDNRSRVHAGINTLQARTGRMSITEPPLQTLPSKGSGGAIRRAVVPEAGHRLWAIDYSSQEARLFASYSEDPGMVACINRGDDLYAWIASEVYQRPITKADPLRDVTKVTMLAWLYGAGASRLADTSGQSVAEVDVFLRRLFEVCPKVRDLTGDHAIGGNFPGYPALAAGERQRTEGLAYIHTGGGRRFSVPGPDELYKAVNGLMQGTGADVLKQAVIRLHRAGLADRIVVPVHDEILFEFPADAGPEMARAAAECMTDPEWLVPLTVEVTGPLSNWGEAYE